MSHPRMELLGFSPVYVCEARSATPGIRLSLGRIKPSCRFAAGEEAATLELIESRLFGI